MINILHRATELDVHVTVDADQATFVLGLAPFETDDNFFVDSVMKGSLAESRRDFGEREMGSAALWWGLGYVQVLQHRPRVDGHDLYGGCQCRFEEKAEILTLMMGNVEGSSA